MTHIRPNRRVIPLDQFERAVQDCPDHHPERGLLQDLFEFVRRCPWLVMALTLSTLLWAGLGLLLWMVWP